MVSFSYSSAATNPLFGHAITEKLTKNNHILWRVQILPAIHGARMEGYLTGVTQVPEAEIDVKQGDKTIKGPNLTYEEWVATDQQVLGYLLSSLSREILT